ncbi:MAG TPA: ABC transporter ATP-binding protein [Bacillota bacterium]|nr:ABC transporter ATP-binding protein [Bacillota bacterium]
MRKNKQDYDSASLKRLFAYLKPYQGWVSFNILVSLSSAAVDISGGYFIKSLTDAALERDLDSILHLTVYVSFVVLAGTAIKFLVKYTMACFASGAVYDIRSQVVAAIERTSYPVIEKYHSGDLISRLSNDIYVIQGFFQNSFSSLVYQPMILLGAFSYLFFINWPLTLITFCLVNICLSITKAASRPIGKYAREIQAGHAVVNSIAQESIGGIPILKAFNLENHFISVFKKAVDELFSGYLKKNLLGSKLGPLYFITHLIPLICAITWGGFAALKGEMTLGSFFAFVYLLHFLSEPLQVIPELFTEVRTVSAAVNRADEVTAVSAERTDGAIFPAAPEQSVIEFKDVHFAYNTEHPVLQGLSFTITKNTKTAIVGKSGGGKSTILKLICGYYTPDRGELSLYGHSYQEWNPEGLRSQMTLVAQDPFLFPGTIMENLSYGRSGAGIDAIQAAAQVAYAHEFIMSFPEGYDTEVGERGNRLSGGQKQRMAIARAVLKDAPILLLDEPTSALDHHSEQLIMQALEEVGKAKTVVVIAHRLSTILSADKIIVVDSGKVVEEGTHEELVKKHGCYYELYHKQFA